MNGEDETHTRVLAEAEAELPPIMVHRATMRVIDGMHRLHAARMRGHDEICVRFFDGPENMVFALAVETNTAHGMPLSLRDREAAADRIVRENPEWSDRVIATMSGLSAKTVGAIRRQSDGDVHQVEARMGRDGRVRPLNCASGRERASEYIAENPGASLREIARAAGISPTTVRDVRARLMRGDDPVPAGRHRTDATAVTAAVHPETRRIAATGRSRPSILGNLKKDPSLRFNEAGRDLLRWLDARTVDPDMWEELVEPLPMHCSYLLAEFAQSLAGSWLAAANRINNRLSEAG
jgi:transposase-like protein